jgi:hypothetical protein
MIPLPPRRPPQARPIEDQFKAASDALNGLQVDGADLDKIKQYLSLVAETTRIIRQKVDEADQVAASRGEQQHRYVSLGSHEIAWVPDISTKLSNTAQTVEKNLADFAAAVDRTAEAMTKIARAYQSADQRNKLKAEQVRKYLNR